MQPFNRPINSVKSHIQSLPLSNETINFIASQICPSHINLRPCTQYILETSPHLANLAASLTSKNKRLSTKVHLDFPPSAYALTVISDNFSARLYNSGTTNGKVPHITSLSL